MASNTEEVVVRIVVDTDSIKKVEERLRALRDKANEYLGSLKIGIDVKGLISELSKTKKRISTFAADANKIAKISVKVVVNSAALNASMAKIKTFAAAANAAVNLNAKVNAAGAGAASGAGAGAVPPPTGGGGARPSAPTGGGGARLAPTSGTGANYKKAAQGIKDYATAIDITTRSYFGFISAQQLGRSIIDPVIKSFADYEDRLLRVGRILGITGEELAVFGERMTKIASSLGVSRNALLELAHAAARVGVGKKDIESFVVQTQKIAIALEMGGAETATAFKSFQLLFKLDVNQLTAVANAFNKVADSSAISSQALVGFLQYLGPVANQFGLMGQKGITAMTAISALLGEMGVSAEVAGSGMQRIFQTLINNTEKAARVAGVSAEEFKQALSVDILQALNMVLVGYKKLDIQQQQSAKTMLKLGNIRVERVFTLLANNVDELAKKQAVATGAFKDGISVESEVAKQLGSLNSQYQQTVNSIEAVAVKGLIPLVQRIKDFMYALREWIAANPVLAEQLSKLIIAFGAIVGAFGTIAVSVFGVVQVFTSLASVVTALYPLIKNLTSAIIEFNVVGATTGWIKTFVADVAILSSVSGLSKWAVTGTLALGGLKTAAAYVGTAFASVGAILAKVVAPVLLVVHLLDRLQAAIRGTKTYTEQFFTYLATENAPQKTAEELAEAAKQAQNLTKEFSKANAENNKFTTSLEKLDNNIKLIGDKAKGLNLAQKFAEARAAMEGTRFTAGKDFAEALGPDLQQKFAALLANGAQPLKQELEKMVFIMRTSIPQGADVAAKKLQEVAAAMDRKLNAQALKGLNEKFKDLGPKERAANIKKELVPTEFGKIAIDLELNGSKNIDAQLAAFTTQLSALAEQAKEIGGEEGRALQQTALFAVNRILESAAGSSGIFRDRLLALKEAFGGNLTAAEQFLDSIKSLNVVYSDKRGVDFINTLKEFGGTADRGVILFQAMTKSVMDFNVLLGPTLVEKYGSSVKGLAEKLSTVKTEAEFAGIALSEGFSGLDLSRISGAIQTLTRRNSLDRELIELRVEYNDLLDKGGGKIEKDINRILEVKRATKELIAAQGFITDAQKESLKVQDALIEMYEEQLKKKQQSADEERRAESTASKIEEYVARSVEYADKFAQANLEGNAAIEAAVHKEEEHLRVLERKATKTEDIVRLRIAGERNIQFAIASTARAQVETARKALESINQKILDIRRSGEQILRGLEAEARPALSVVEQARDQLEKLIEAAEEGKFFGKENDARLKFEQKIARLREQAIEENERKALEFIDKKYAAEKALADLQRRQEEDAFASRTFDKDLKDKRLAAINSGTPTNEAVAAEKDSKRIRAEERAALARERQRAELDLENVNREGGRFFSTNPDVKNDLERMFREMSVNFAKALTTGADRRVEMDRQAKAASESLQTAATALKQAAAALLASVDPDARKKSAEAEFAKKKGEKEAEAKDFEGKAATASEISKALNTKIKGYVSDLLNEFAGKEKSKENLDAFRKKQGAIIDRISNDLEKATRGTGIDFGLAFNDAVHELVNTIEFGVSGITLPSTILEDITSIEKIEQQTADRIAQKAIPVREEISKMGESYIEMMKLIEKDAESVRELIRQITNEAVAAGVDAAKVANAERNAVPDKTGKASTTPNEVKAPTEGTTTGKATTKYGKALQESVGAQTTAAKDQKDSSEKMQASASAYTSSTESFEAATAQLELAIQEAAVRKSGSTSSQKQLSFETADNYARQVQAVDEAWARMDAGKKERESAAKQPLALPGSMDDAMSFLGTLAALGGGKTTVAEESMRVFGKSLKDLAFFIDVANANEKERIANSGSLASIDAGAEAARAEQASREPLVQTPQERMTDMLKDNADFRLEQQQKEKSAAVPQLDLPSDAAEQLNVDGGVAAEAADQAGEDIDQLAETQDKQVAALKGLTESISSYATTSTQQIVQNTMDLVATKTELRAAEALFNSLPA